MSNSPIYNRIATILEKRHHNGLFRHCAATTYSPPIRIECSTNSYLGLHANSVVAAEALRLSGRQMHGNLASRLIATTSDLYHQLEKEIADWKKTETALVFNSGYAANIGVIQALCQRSTEVFCDRLNHASIYDGIRLSGCRMVRYKHCDMTDLKQRLSASKTTEKIIITDTVFSMDGDRAPLSDIAELAHSYNALVMVDEAHATGLFGATGTGLVEATGTEDDIAIRMGTLSKSIAGLGGYVAVNDTLRDFFVNFSRSLIYSTGLPHSILAHNCAAVRYIRANPHLGSEVLQGAEKMREDLKNLGCDTKSSTTQIIPYSVKNEDDATSLSLFLRENGIKVPAILPPTVPAGTARLRFSWSSLITDEDRDTIISTLKKWRKTHG